MSFPLPQSVHPLARMNSSMTVMLDPTGWSFLFYRHPPLSERRNIYANFAVTAARSSRAAVGGTQASHSLKQARRRIIVLSHVLVRVRISLGETPSKCSEHIILRFSSGGSRAHNFCPQAGVASKKKAVSHVMGDDVLRVTQRPSRRTRAY
jgi:hypothetical protein